MSTPGRLLKLALVEYLGEADPAADLVVALSPIALQQCADRGIDVTVLDDHITRLDLVSDQVAYLRWQISWVNRLDDLAGLEGAARSSALAFKGPIDTAVLTSRILRQLLTVLAPAQVSYIDRVRPSPSEGTPAGGLYLWGDDSEPRPAGRLVEAVCADLGIALQRITLPVPPTGDPSPTASTRLRRALGPLLGPRRALQTRQPAREHGPVVVMTWYGGYGARTFLRRQLSNGSRVLFLVRGRPWTRLVQPALTWWRRRSPRIPLNGRAPRSVPEGAEALFREIDQWSATPGTGAVVAPRLERVLVSMCPAVGGAANALADAFRRTGVERVACANPNSTEEFAALLAAERLGLRRQLVQHGDHLMGYEAWVGYDVPNVDEWLCSDPTVPAHVRAVCDAVGVPPPQFTFTPYRRPGPTISPNRFGDDGAVCYVPTLFQAGSALFGPTIDDAWSYRWQRRLLDWMADTDQTFIWKAFPPGNHAEDPVPGLLQRRGITKVRYETRPLTATLGSADRVVLDFASTALFEVVLAGMPTLALSFPRFMPLRPAAAEMFRPILRECGSEDDALRAIEGFLASKPTTWVLDRRRLGVDAATAAEPSGGARPAPA